MATTVHSPRTYLYHWAYQDIPLVYFNKAAGNFADAVKLEITKPEIWQ